MLPMEDRAGTGDLHLSIRGGHQQASSLPFLTSTALKEAGGGFLLFSKMARIELKRAPTILPISIFPRIPGSLASTRSP